MNRQLDSFESTLLGELRIVVANRVQETRRASNRAGRLRTSRRLVLGAAAAVAVGLAVVLPAAWPTAAYAVQQGPSGDVSVHINRLEDAPGLQAALRRLGVNAQVQYLGDRMQCTPGRYEPAPSAPNSRTRFEFGSNGIRVELDRRDVSDGQTVVIAASRIKDGVHGEIGITAGTVRSCNPTAFLGP